MSSSDLELPWREDAGPLFDRNAHHYDWVNSVITFGMDRRWRGWLIERAWTVPGMRALDVCAGTGLVGLNLAARGAEVTLLDASAEMLATAQRRAMTGDLHVRLQVTSIQAATLAPASFDLITLSFGLRYLPDPVAALVSLRGALAENGQLLILEAVRPPNDLPGRMAGLYFFVLAPRLAAMLARRAELYEGLTASVRALGGADAVRGLLRAAGFVLSEQRSWAGGLIYFAVALPGNDHILGKPQTALTIGALGRAKEAKGFAAEAMHLSVADQCIAS